MGRAKKEAIFPAAPPLAETDERYGEFIARLKNEVQHTRTRAAVNANSELIRMYWRIGNAICRMQESEGWGAKVIDRISLDLRSAFPDMKGFSARNLKYMRSFAQAWPDFAIGQQAVAQLPWGSNIALLTKLDDPDHRLWYAQQAVEHGWSRSVLEMQIDARVMERSGKALANFDKTLPPAQSDMAQGIFKDPYLFDFLGTDGERREREVEQGLMTHVQEFLLELGKGFAFVGRQVPLEVGDSTFRIDMLFYHLRLRCFVVVELKTCSFDPGFAGQINFYRSVVDDLLRQPGDGKTIGLLLVKDKNNAVVRYAFDGIDAPLGVASWTDDLTESLPDDLKSSLPTIEEIEREFQEVGENMMR